MRGPHDPFRGKAIPPPDAADHACRQEARERSRRLREWSKALVARSPSFLGRDEPEAPGP